MLTYRRSDSLEIRGYSDADFAGDREVRNPHQVKDRIQDQTIDVKHISMTHMLVDPLAEGLPPSIFLEHVAGMGLLEAF